MDDPISALDSKVKKKIWKRVFQTMLKGKTRILATNAIDFMHLADHIIVLKEGNVAIQGSYEEVQKSPIVKEILAIHNKNEQSKNEAFNEAKKARVQHKAGCSSGSSNSDDDLVMNKETSSKSLEMTAVKTSSKLAKIGGHNLCDTCSDCDNSSCDEIILSKDD
jgi:ATP-binding cassette, subfamily C (CFTR/MRP), member 4